MIIGAISKLHFFMCLCIGITFQFSSYAQEGLPVYSDYLTDNYYLIHPSMAGISNCGKIRLTARKQWFDIEDAPSLNTFSINQRVGDSKSGVGGILYLDRNGFHSQVGAYLSYAHHLMFSRNELDLNMLSFGITAGIIQYRLDRWKLLNTNVYDPILSGGRTNNVTEYNVDVGLSYHYLNFYAHGTIKNLMENEGINEQVVLTNNLRRFILSSGAVFSRFGSEWSYEPSFMFQYKDATKEMSIDLNFKIYKEFDFGKLWGGFSYRTSLDEAEDIQLTDHSSLRLQYITPFVGFEFKKLLFAYTYSHQLNSIVLSSGAYHQITVGYNFSCKKKRYDCNCPAVK